MDITGMWAHEAIRLIERLPYFWQVVPNSDPPMVLSAVHAHFQRIENERVVSVDELRGMGLEVEEV